MYARTHIFIRKGVIQVAMPCFILYGLMFYSYILVFHTHVQEKRFVIVITFAYDKASGLAVTFQPKFFVRKLSAETEIKGKLLLLFNYFFKLHDITFFANWHELLLCIHSLNRQIHARYHAICLVPPQTVDDLSYSRFG